MTANRRSVLRGSLGAGAITIGLPLLECFLNQNGTALANGAPIPIRFGTWFWGLGVNPARWVPSKVGTAYDMPAELKAFETYRDRISILSGFKVNLDGQENFPHISGNIGFRTGAAPTKEKQVDFPTFDVLVSDAFGTRSRFRSLELTATGNPKDSYSFRGANIVNAAETSPMTFYSRVFGPEFQDPNAANFTPDTRIMLEKSVLSAVREQAGDLNRSLGQADRDRLDEYFTSVRQLEQQLELQLRKPPPAEACVKAASISDGSIGTDIEIALKNHELMSGLLAIALACNQTRVFNMVYSDSSSALRRPGASLTHHVITHEEGVDAQLGYQPQATWFVERSMEAWSVFISSLAKIREGEGTLLDNCLVVAHSDTQIARTHSVDGIPVMIAGKAGGRIRSGIHVAGNGDPVSRIGLTAMQVMGLSIERWGVGSMETSKVLSEILV